jgi:hypothetical protein
MRILYKTGGGASKEYLEIILKAKLDGVEAWAVVSSWFLRSPGNSISIPQIHPLVNYSFVAPTRPHLGGMGGKE